jgi:hypothetical protein
MNNKESEHEELREIFKKMDENQNNRVEQSNEQEIMNHSKESINISAEIKPNPASISEKNIQISNLLSLPSSCDENPKSDRKQVKEEEKKIEHNKENKKKTTDENTSKSSLNKLLQQIQALKYSEDSEIRNCADNLAEVLKKRMENSSIEKLVTPIKIDQILQTTPKNSSVPVQIQER